MEWWVWLLIALGVVLLIGIIAFIVIQVMKPKPVPVPVPVPVEQRTVVLNRPEEKAPLVPGYLDRRARLAALAPERAAQIGYGASGEERLARNAAVQNYMAALRNPYQQN